MILKLKEEKLESITGTPKKKECEEKCCSEEKEGNKTKAMKDSKKQILENCTQKLTMEIRNKWKLFWKVLNVKTLHLREEQIFSAWHVLKSMPQMEDGCSVQNA
jgi:hypothetical protein